MKEYSPDAPTLQANCGTAPPVLLLAHELGALREGINRDAGDVCRRCGDSSATIYKRKAKYGGLEVSDARRLRQLEEEHTRLKRLLADAMLDSPTQPLIQGINGPWA